MIRFADNVRIHQFQFAMVAVFLNASMWSTSSQVPVVITAIDDAKPEAEWWNGYYLTVNLTIGEGGSTELRSLLGYLQRTLPKDYAVSAAGGSIQIVRQAERAKARSARA